MTDDDEKFWTSTRHWTHFKDRKYFDMLIDRIEELREQTDPAKGDASAAGKDAAAFRALAFAGDLVEALVGWAISHQVGLAAERLRFVPRGPGGEFRDLPGHREAIADVDDHRHELVGDKLIRGGAVSRDTKTGKEGASLTDIDPMTARAAAINLLHSNPGAMPRKVADHLHDALLALDMNDVRPILKPSTAYRKKKFAEERLQLEAICFAHFRHSTGLANHAQAMREISEAFDVPFDTFKGWEERLRKPQALGQLEVSRAVHFANNAGAMVAESVATVGKINARPEMIGHDHYGDDRVLDAVKRFHAMKAEKAARAPNRRRKRKVHK